MTHTVVDSRPPPARGAVLADDMGLGKTLQTLALIVDDMERSKERVGPTLVIAPTGKMFRWLNLMFHSFCLSYFVYLLIFSCLSKK